MNRIILLGPKHVGKSSAGRHLAAMRGLSFYDCDQLILDRLSQDARENNLVQNIVRQQGTNSPCRILNLRIGALFAAVGKQKFMELEFLALQWLFREKREFVLATGGGLADNSVGLAQLRDCVRIAISDDPLRVWKRVRRTKIPEFVVQSVRDSYGDRLSQREKEREYKKTFLSFFQRRMVVYAEHTDFSIPVGESAPYQLAKRIHAIL